MEQREQVLCAILDAGELLLTAGAEVARVEDTIRRMAQAYGFGRVDVLTITASMIVTAQAEDGAVLTQTRRILRRETDMPVSYTHLCCWSVFSAALLTAWRSACACWGARPAGGRAGRMAGTQHHKRGAGQLARAL